jgi:hypothetical protein
LNKKAREYYFACYHDLKNGFLSVSEARYYIKIHEEMEEYEACEGIKLAIEDYESK